MTKKDGKAAQYVPIIVHIFQKHWKKGIESFEFHRDEMVAAAAALGVERPDNLGDVIYSFKFRRSLPGEITESAPNGKSWLLEGAGHGLYRFGLLRWAGRLLHRDRMSPRSKYLTRHPKLSLPMHSATNRPSSPKYVTTV